MCTCHVEHTPIVEWLREVSNRLIHKLGQILGGWEQVLVILPHRYLSGTEDENRGSCRTREKGLLRG